MEDHRNISDALRHLEDLRDAGYLDAEQFLAEVRDLLSGLGVDEARAVLAASEAQAGHAEAAEAALQEAEARAAEGTGLYALVDEGPPPPDRPDPDQPAPPLPDEEPWLQGIALPGAGQARPRVVIKGALPWEQPAKATGVRVEAAEDQTGIRSPDHKELLHRELARMAVKDIRRLNRTRDPRRMVLASLLLPGLGQILLDRPGEGAALAVIYLLGLAYAILMEEYSALFVTLPVMVLAAALAHKQTMLHNYFVERKQLLEKRRVQRMESSLNVKRSVREREWEDMERETRPER